MTARGRTGELTKVEPPRNEEVKGYKEAIAPEYSEETSAMRII